MSGCIALIVAAGRGNRFGGEVPKQYLPLAGKPVLRHSVERFLGHPDVDAVRVVIHAADNAFAQWTVYNQMIGVGGHPEALAGLREIYAAGDNDVRLRQEHAIKLSSGEVSRLARHFLAYLSRLHYSRAEPLKATLASDGGWPMHIDATGESGQGTLLVVMAGWRKWVLGSWKIATERCELILPCLQDTVERFGAPCAAMRDMGRAVTPAIEALVVELDADIPVLVCHQHFLADIGKDLLEPCHSELRGFFRRTKTRPKLRSLVRKLGRKIGEQIDESRKAVQQWQSMAEANHRIPEGRNGLAVVRTMAQWTLDYKADSTGLDFPFDRPYLDFYNRCSIGLRAIEAFLRIAPDDRKVVGVMKRLHRILGAVSGQVPGLQIVQRIRRRAALFDELRNQLRLASNLPEQESEEDLNIMRKDFDTLLSG